jgi:hypothetical protein
MEINLPKHANPDVLRMQKQINDHLNNTPHKNFEDAWAKGWALVFRMGPDKRLVVTYEEGGKPKEWDYRPWEDKKK